MSSTYVAGTHRELLLRFPIIFKHSSTLSSWQLIPPPRCLHSACCKLVSPVRPVKVSVARAAAAHPLAGSTINVEAEQQQSKICMWERRTLVLQAAAVLSASIALASSPPGEALSAVLDDSTATACSRDAAGLLITQKVFFDIAIDRVPVGRIVVGLYGEDAPIGAKRFAEMAAGNKGVGYKKKEFVKITPSYIQNAGLRSFTLGGDSTTVAKFTGGETATDVLAPELDALNGRCPNTNKNVAGSVSIVVKDLTKPPPKPKLIARDGKFQVVEEEVRPDPNGTQFTICTADSPELDATNLVVGRVIEGFEVLKAISRIKVVQENSSSPYFKAAKLVGDTRAVVAERGFNRPYSKVIISRSGLLE